MKFTLNIKPTVIEGYGTLRQAQTHMSGYLVYGNKFGCGFQNRHRDPDIVYGYNIEVFKRGPHRHNKHYVVYKYSFPIEMFKLLNLGIRQGTKTFKIVSNECK